MCEWCSLINVILAILLDITILPHVVSVWCRDSCVLDYDFARFGRPSLSRERSLTAPLRRTTLLDFGCECTVLNLGCVISGDSFIPQTGRHLN